MVTSRTWRLGLTSLTALLSSLLLGSAAAQQRQLTAADYARAERLLPRSFAQLVRNESVDARWIGGTDRFWYRRELERGFQYVLVDAAANRAGAAFDHAALAAALGQASGKPRDSSALVIDDLQPSADGSVAVTVAGEPWLCGAGRGCRRATGGPAPVRADELASPDGQWLAYVRDHDLYLRGRGAGEEIRLTTDGETDHDYGTRPDAGQSPVTDRRLGVKHPPVAVWSPDSRRLVTHRLDQRGVAEQILTQAVADQGDLAVFHRFRSPNPGDSIVPTGKLLIVDVATRSVIPVDLEPLLAMYFTAFDFGQIWWSSDSERIYVMAESRGWKAVRLFEVDARTGKARMILEETSPTYYEPALEWGAGRLENVRTLMGGAELIWFSERDGWGHLYLYDAKSGTLENQITKGPWVVRTLLRVDEAKRQLYFTAAGREPRRDPYYRHLYRINFDGTGLVLLTPEDADHDVRISPSGRYFVDAYSRADTIPVTVVRSIDGKLVRPIETADVSALLATGWRWPERFTVKARDGTTDLYGLIFRPSNFDSTRRYPVIDDYYPGGQRIQTQKRLTAALGSSSATAELGFVVVTLDGMGTALRSKPFHDVSYQNFADATLPDHLTGLRQLAAAHPFLDLDRVGIQGSSAGGYGSVRAILAYPDFYRVAVSSSGNTTPRNALAIWVEKWFGYPVGSYYDEQDNRKLVGNLKGKLLLACGDLDDTVPDYQSRQLIDALIKANKDFDLLVVPNQNHGITGNPYFIRRRWDYFVRHLLGAEPPDEYRLKPM
jgi:dipeptidyl aminopeptidase/acylaminoacyl peptidase